MKNDVVTYAQEDVGFYPTPLELAERMLTGIDFEYISSVLEPSAGKGNLADAVYKKLKSAHWRSRDDFYGFIDCVEIDPNLRYILSGKGYHVVHDDFLTFRTHKRYDLIVMNPPFAEGDKHLLKALDLMKDGGKIVCLLNAETIRNRFTNSRRLLWYKLSKYEARIQYIENAFRDAERETDVTIALIRVDIPQAERESFIFEGLKEKSYEEINYECRDLVAGDFIAQIVKQYEIEVEAGVKLINEYFAMLPHIRRSFDDNSDFPTIDMKLHGENDYSSTKLTVNGYVGMVRYKYWYALFGNKAFTGMLTSNLQSELYDKVKDLKQYDFSVFNIRQIQAEIMRLMSKGVEDTILALFDNLSAQYSYFPEMKKNIHYYNGWATNKAHKINKKVIIPINGAFSSYAWKQEAFEVYPVYKVMSDLEKTLSYLDTGSTEVVDDLNERLTICSRNGTTRNIPLRYFSITLYKKGTCHITFTDLDLLDKLNIYGSQKKGWLPPCYGKKHYSDMKSDEKAVIDEFQGAEEYEKVMARTDYFIVSDPQQLLLGAGSIKGET